MAPDVPETTAALAHAFAIAGDRTRAERLFETSRPQLPLYEQAIVLTALDRRAEAVASLVAARARGELVAGLFAAEPRLRPLRGLPEFARLREGTSAPARGGRALLAPPGLEPAR